MKDERLNNSPMLPLEVLVLKYFFDEPKSYFKYNSCEKFLNSSNFSSSK